MKLKPALVAGTVAALALGLRAIRRSRRSISFENKVVLISGASRGLGLVVARQLAMEGARLVICARKADELAEAKEDLLNFGNSVHTVVCDISKAEDVAAMFAEVREQVGEVQVLINCAGIIQVGPYENMSAEDYETTMDVHFWGIYNLMEHAVPSMIRQKFGRIGNVISIGGKIPVPHLTPYTASKYAAAGYSEGAGVELAKHNIRVSSIYPGLMQTGSPRNILVKGQHKYEYGWFKIASSLPLVSVSAEYAAKRIVDVVRHGDRLSFLGISSKLATTFAGIAPRCTNAMLSSINRLLPNAAPTDTGTRRGYECESALSQSGLARSTNEAARHNNQYR